MLSEKIRAKNKVMAVCEKSRDLFPGEVFEKIVAAEGCRELPEGQTFVCCGEFSNEKMMIRSRDGRYYFYLTDGWGVEDGALYALRVNLLMDFRHSTAQSTIVDECKKLIGTGVYTKKSFIGAMAYRCEKEALETIIEVVTKNDEYLK